MEAEYVSLWLLHLLWFSKCMKALFQFHLMLRTDPLRDLIA